MILRKRTAPIERSAPHGGARHVDPAEEAARLREQMRRVALELSRVAERLEHVKDEGN